MKPVEREQFLREIKTIYHESALRARNTTVEKFSLALGDHQPNLPGSKRTKQAEKDIEAADDHYAQLGRADQLVERLFFYEL